MVLIHCVGFEQIIKADAIQSVLSFYFSTLGRCLRKLTVVKCRICTFLFKELLMISLFDNISVFHKQDNVSVSNRRKSVSNDEACSAAHQPFHRLAYLNFGAGINA